MEEKEYRSLVASAFKRIEKGFTTVDPDLAEFELTQGAVTIAFKNKSKCILSTQPSLRQIWLANAAKGIAYHFYFDPSLKAWMDDKNRGIELFSAIREIVKANASLEINF